MDKFIYFLLLLVSVILVSVWPFYREMLFTIRVIVQPTRMFTAVLQMSIFSNCSCLSNFNEHKNTVLHQKVSDLDAAELISKTILTRYEAYKTVNNEKYDVFADISKSEIHVASKHFKLGDDVTVKITLFGKDGQPLDVGGDLIKIWIEDGFHNATVNGYVTDHGNGSYTGHVRALWRGKSMIKVAIASSKEEVASQVIGLEKWEFCRYNIALFKSEISEEVTMCFDKIDGENVTKDYCKYTSEYAIRPLYCHRPSLEGLDCKHRVWPQHIRCPSSELSERRVFPNILGSESVIISGDTDAITTTAGPCHIWPALLTWWDTAPSGFYYKNKWRQLTCSAKQTTSSNVCFQERNILLFGDEYIYEWFSYIKRTLVANLINLDYSISKNSTDVETLTIRGLKSQIAFTHNKYGVPLKAEKIGTTLPQRLGLISKASLRHNDVIALQLHLQDSNISPRILIAYVRKLRVQLDIIIAGNPEVKIVVIGPYFTIEPRSSRLTEFARKFTEEIMFDELNGIHDKLIYLNLWDLTNTGLNLTPEVTSEEAVKLFLSFIC